MGWREKGCTGAKGRGALDAVGGAFPRADHAGLALEDLRLDGTDVLHAGRETFPLADRIRAVATHRIWTDIDPL